MISAAEPRPADARWQPRSLRWRPAGRRAHGALDVGRATPALLVRALSGGTQQKVILARWLALKVGVLLLDEAHPGRGYRGEGADSCADPQVRQSGRRGAGVIQRSHRADDVFATASARCVSRRSRRASRPSRASMKSAPCRHRRMMMAKRFNFAGQMPLIAADRAVCRHRAADRPVSVPAQPDQHPGAVVDHGGDRYRHDLRHRRRWLRPLGWLDRGAGRAALPR